MIKLSKCTRKWYVFLGCIFHLYLFCHYQTFIFMIQLILVSFWCWFTSCFLMALAFDIHCCQVKFIHLLSEIEIQLLERVYCVQWDVGIILLRNFEFSLNFGMQQWSIYCTYFVLQVRFHIISHRRLRNCSSPNTSSLHYLNTEQLMKTLISLFNLYEANRNSNLTYKNEAEFHSFYVLLHLGSNNQLLVDLCFIAGLLCFST